MGSARTAGALMVAVVFGASCDGSVSAKDDASIEIADQRTLEPAPYEPDQEGFGTALQVGRPIILVGEDSTKPGHLLHDISDAFRFTAGDLVVANRGSGEIRVFDSDGNLVAEWGGVGSGPKEFAALWSVWPLGNDSIGAYDPVNQRISYWNRRNGFLSTHPVRFTKTPLLLGRFADGRLLMMHRLRNSRRAEVGQIVVDSAEYFAVDVWNQTVDSLGTFPDATTYPVRNELLGGRIIYAPVPAGPRGVVAVGDSSFHYGFSDDWSIIEIDATGRPVQQLSWDMALRERTGDMARLWLDSAVSRVDPQFGEPSVRNFFTKFPQPTHFPTFDQLIVDGLERLWIRRYVNWDDSAASWLVVDSEGSVVGDVELDPNFTPLQITEEWILGILLVDSDVETVAVHPIRNGRP